MCDGELWVKLYIYFFLDNFSKLFGCGYMCRFVINGIRVYFLW